MTQVRFTRRSLAVGLCGVALAGPLSVLAAPDKPPQPVPERATNPLVITEADHEQTRKIKVGSVIEVRLVGAEERTGWEASPVTGASVERAGAQPGEKNVAQSPEFTPAKDARDKSVGTYVFRYRAVAAGKSALRFVYVYPGGPFPMRRDATKLVKELKVSVEVGP